MGTCTVSPGPTMNASNVLSTVGSSDACQRSPPGAVTDISNALVVAVRPMLTRPAGAGPEYGPISEGVANHSPCCTVPPVGVYEPAAVLFLLGDPTRSGSPFPGP